MRRHLTYANVVATLALVFAMTGGALAAKHYLINSTKQINPKVLRKLKGASGKNGATGATGAAGKEGAPGREGPQGHTGERGPSAAFGAEAESVGFPSAPNAAEVVAAVKLHAGNYTLVATVTPHNESNLFTEAGCVLLEEGAASPVFDEATTTLEGKSTAGAKRSIALSGTRSPAGDATIDLACKTPVTEGKYESAHLTATQVGGLG
jgi:hypothetical protein